MHAVGALLERAVADDGAELDDSGLAGLLLRLGDGIVDPVEVAVVRKVNEIAVDLAMTARTCYHARRSGPASRTPRSAWRRPR